MEVEDKQRTNTETLSGKERSLANIAPHVWKKGQSGNPAGRPKEKTLKEHVRAMLERMTDEERDAFLTGMPKEIIWKMAEGNPHTTEDKRIEIAQPTPILGGASNATHLEAIVKQEILSESDTEAAS